MEGVGSRSQPPSAPIGLLLERERKGGGGEGKGKEGGARIKRLKNG